MDTELRPGGLRPGGLRPEGLRLDGLGVRHDGRPILRGVSLHVAPGESLCLIGASGSGKSLAAAAIMGLLPSCMAAQGTVQFGRTALPASDGAALRALWHGMTCLLPQEPGLALAPLLGAARQAALAPPRLGRAASLAWLARFGLDRRAAGRLPSELSGGMAQRLLAALVTRTPARVLVADEPTKGLDPARRAELLALLAALRDDGRALLVITHDLAVPRALGGQVAVLEDGAVTECGPPEAVLGAPRSRFGRACLAALPGQAPRPDRTAGTAVAEAAGLTLGHGRRRLAGPLDLALREGSVTAVLGPSGVGKTTLGDTLLGLAPPLGGQVRWFGGVPDRAARRALRPRFQKLHQDPTAVFPQRRPFEGSFDDLRRLPGGADALRRVPGLLDRLGLRPALLARRPGEVSGGEAQRLALVRLLAVRPALLVADEPSSRLDPPTQAEALRLLRAEADSAGMAVLLISHDAALAATVSDAVLVLDGNAPTR